MYRRVGSSWRWLAIAALLVLGLVYSACAPDAPASKTSSAASSAGQTEAVAVEVFRGGVRLAKVSVSDIQVLPSVTVKTTEGVNSGPTLRSVLESAGVSTFRKVTVSGTYRGRLASEEISLKDDPVLIR